MSWGLNMELFSDAAWETIIPGKHQHIGKQRYLKALEYAVSIFGPINTRSILIVGLEDARHTIEGAATLASMGVMPILSPFRPLEGSDLETQARVRLLDQLAHLQRSTPTRCRVRHSDRPNLHCLPE